MKRKHAAVIALSAALGLILVAELSAMPDMSAAPLQPSTNTPSKTKLLSTPEPTDEQRLFARSIVFSQVSLYCAESRGEPAYLSQFRQWHKRHQQPLKQGRITMSELAQAEGQDMAYVVNTLNHMVDKKWAYMDPEQRTDYCSDIMAQMKL